MVLSRPYKLIMETITLKCDPEASGTRLDTYIGENTDFSRSFAAKLCDEGMVTCSGKALSKKYKICGNELLELVVPDPESIEAVPEKMELDIVYEDESVIVINKPQGLVVHPAPGNESGTLVNGILYHCGNSLSGINGVVRPGIVHRIDKDTSGLIVAAKTNEAHLSLTQQWHSSKPERRYVALVHGNIREEEFVINLPVGRSRSDRKKMAVTPDGRSAVTHVRVCERFGAYTLVECVLDTGRTHQIRVHMAHSRHPVVGDPVYGVKKEEFKLSGQLLHAQTLGFIHPVTGKKMTFSCPLPDYFERVLKVLRSR